MKCVLYHFKPFSIILFRYIALRSLLVDCEQSRNSIDFTMTSSKMAEKKYAATHGDVTSIYPRLILQKYYIPQTKHHLSPKQ